MAYGARALKIVSREDMVWSLSSEKQASWAHSQKLSSVAKSGSPATQVTNSQTGRVMPAERPLNSIAPFISVALFAMAGFIHTPTADADIDYRCWTETFADDFDSLSLRAGSSGTWKTVYTWGDGGINKEKQYYADPRRHGINPFLIDNGVLHIEAKPTSPENLTRVGGLPYTSGLLTTEMSFDQMYGLFEMRARLPEGRGLWPAFWLLPTDKKKWDSRGYWRLPEIDIMEFLGHEKSVYHASLHTKTPTGRGGHRTKHGYTVYGTKIEKRLDLTEDYHTYGLEWDEDEIVWYFDGEEVKRQVTPEDSRNDRRYILINLAVGGNWPGDPDTNTEFPAHFSIDYVRAYKRKSTCASFVHPPGRAGPKSGDTLAIAADRREKM